MQRSVLCGLILGMACLLLSGVASATEKAEQIKRDSVRLNQIKKIALTPVVIQVRFDQSKRIPDRGRLLARKAVAARIPMLFQEAMKSGKYVLLLPDAMPLALQELHWQPTDLYATISKGTWESPVETIGNEEKDKALLLANREEMKKTPVEMTLFRYLWHDRPGIEVGLASFQLNAQAKIDTERARILGAKLGVDALLFCQVGDMEVHEGVSLFRFPRLFSGFKSTSIHLYITLVSAQDGEILWQARARGLQSHEKDESVEGGSIGESYRTQVLAQPCTIFWQTEGWAERLEKILATHNHADHAYPSELRMAIEGAMEAVKSLTDDLYNGTGKVLKTALTAIGS